MYSHCVVFAVKAVTLEGSDITMTASENNIPLVRFIDPALL